MKNTVLKKATRLFVMAILAAGSASAFAFPFPSICDLTSRMFMDELANVNAQKEQGNRLAAEIEGDRRLISEISSKLEIWNHALKIHDSKIEALNEAISAFQKARIYLEGTVSTDHSLKFVLEQIRNSQRLSPDRRLSEQLREIARTGIVNEDARENLLEFSIRIKLVEKTHAEFAAAEVSLIEDYLNGRSSLVDGMLNTLNHISERLMSDLQQAILANNQDRATVADLGKQATDVKGRLAARVQEANALNAAIEASSEKAHQLHVQYAICMSRGF